ncbi:MAG: thermonuclease family protein [Planctomycetota bacterium]
MAVLDGDTLQWPDGQRLRLPAIDAPELGRPLAQEARDFLAQLLDGQAFTLHPERPGRDDYGRQLADVRVAGRSLSRELLVQGLAWVSASQEPSLLAAQREAVAAKRGVHARIPQARPGLLVLTDQRIHRPGCQWLRKGVGAGDVSSDLAAAFASGRAPCRSCLVWPP